MQWEKLAMLKGEAEVVQGVQLISSRPFIWPNGINLRDVSLMYCLPACRCGGRH